MIRIYTLLLIAALCWQCQNSTTEKSTPEATTSKIAYYPSLPDAMMQQLINQCDYVDYIYYQLPISMSMDEKSGILNALRHVSANPAPLNKACKSIGRVIYQQSGETLVEAELFMSEGCQYFLFLDDNKPKYGNLMTDEGIQFYNGAIKQAQEMRQQQQ